MVIVSGFEPLAYRLGALPKTLKHRKDGHFRVVRSWFNHCLATYKPISKGCSIIDNNTYINRYLLAGSYALDNICELVIQRSQQ